jgi:hypothetical protein
MSGSVFDNDPLSGVTATVSELNLLDGDTSVGSSITITNTDGFIVHDGSTTKLIPASDVATYAAASAGDITAVTAGDGLTGGGTSGALSLAVGAGTGIDVAADAISVDVSDFLTNGADNRLVTATGTDAMNGEASLTFDGNTLTVTDLVTDTNAGTFTAVDINFDKTGASTSNNTMIGINIDMDNTTANSGTNTMTAIKATPTLQSGGGVLTLKGMEIIATSHDSPEDSTVRALDLTSTGGDYNQGIFINTDDANGWDMRIVSSADTGDYFQIATTTHGATTIKTKDDDNNAAAHLSFDVDGDVIIGGVTPKLVIGDAGAEDTMLVFDGNAQDFRIGLDDGTDTLEIGKGSAHGTTTAITIDSNVNVQIMHNTAVADGEVSGELALFQAGEDLTAGEVVYFKSDGKVYKAVATAAATSRCIAMATASISANAMGPFLLKGFARFNSEFPTWTVGGALYTPEAETSSKNVPEQAAPDTDGDFVQIVGYAIGADAIYFCPDSTVVEVA